MSETTTGIKLFDSELKVMDVLWTQGDRTAKQISETLGERVGWNVNTTYTVIKKCVAKGAVERRDPGFVCRAVLSREEVQRSEADDLIDKLFGGSAELFLSAYLGGRRLSPEEAEKLRALVDSAEKR